MCGPPLEMFKRPQEHLSGKKVRGALCSLEGSLQTPGVSDCTQKRSLEQNVSQSMSWKTSGRRQYFLTETRVLVALAGAIEPLTPSDLPSPCELFP